MPFHFADGDDSYFPDTNARRGLAYLGRSLQAAGADVHLALAGYNGGLALISSPQSDWPAESIRYAYWGAGIYSDARDGVSLSGRLNEWLAAGGAGLCRAAGQHLNLGS
jgi:soluble lytic murein transglycosylase-like protein